MDVASNVATEVRRAVRLHGGPAQPRTALERTPGTVDPLLSSPFALVGTTQPI